MDIRRKTKKINIADVAIGGNEPILVQSMTNTKTDDIKGTITQIQALKQAGCRMVRLAVPDMQAAKAIEQIKKQAELPIVADIHFDYRLAIAAAQYGADKIRINPGNIGDKDRIKAVADECKKRSIPIRIGVNGGSLPKELLNKYKAPTAQAICEAAQMNIKLLEDCDFTDIVVSMKSSDVSITIKSYELLAQKCDYPFHIGVTEAGTERIGLIKSAIGIGALLSQGIGDTIRVSLTADPVKEISAGYDILKALGMNEKGVTVISCPTCGRTNINLEQLVHKVEKGLSGVEKKLTVAVMGCAVNGPGEAREADLGIAGGDGCCLLFSKGEIIGKMSEQEALARIIEMAERF